MSLGNFAKTSSSVDRLDGAMLFTFGALATAILYNNINWLHYFILFWYIDIIGYWPAWIASRVTSGNRIHPFFSCLYNLTHSTTGALAGAVIYLSFYDFYASLAAIPLHLGIDRGILGNRLKPLGEKF